MTSQGQQGPYHIDQIKSMCAAGVLTTDSLCWTEPWTEWRPVADVIDRGVPKVGIPSRVSSGPHVPTTPDESSRHQVDAAQVGNASLNELLCCRCGAAFTEKPKKAFFTGLRKFLCGACGHQNVYPPTNGTMGCFVIVIVLVALISISILKQGGVPLPGLLFFVALTGLVEGLRARGRVKASRKFFQSKAGGQS